MKTPNTRIAYLYRDASNYKAAGEVVVAGQITFRQLSHCLDGGEFFIPQQVGWEPLQSELTTYSGGQLTEDDHVWHELRAEDFAPTDAEPTLPCSARDVVEAFTRAHAEGWNVGRYARELGLPLEDKP